MLKVTLRTAVHHQSTTVRVGVVAAPALLGIYQGRLAARMWLGLLSAF